MAGGSFRQSEWDPKKIVSQIAVMQVYFYLVSTAVWMFIAMLTGRTFSVDTLLSWEVAVRAPPSLPTRAAGAAIPCPRASVPHPICRCRRWRVRGPRTLKRRAVLAVGSRSRGW